MKNPEKSQRWPLMALPLALAITLSWVCPTPGLAQERMQLTFQDLMKVRRIQSPSISADGRWVALSAVPDRGDGEVLVPSVDAPVRYAVPRGGGPVLSEDGAWVAMRMEPPFEAREKAGSVAEPSCGCRVGIRRQGFQSGFGALLAAVVWLARRRRTAAQ